ncbi:AraC family transcriptional regulator [Chitinophaga varians]|uniref:AraC family transcriptional regulator n=1 Tax=Chitinophaga varians TaxID=2202339 RepID=UPI00165EFC68|nr:helix-turn-helix domain-containing protein [Chitinophaga varians]MBC9913059.1 AraC family transcriptional regulator [Chitinophaga varians]
MPVTLYQYIQSLDMIRPSAALSRLITGFYVLPASQLQENCLAVSDGMPTIAFLPHPSDQVTFTTGDTATTLAGAWISSQYLEKTRLQLPQPQGDLLIIRFNPVLFYQRWPLLPARLQQGAAWSLPDMLGRDGATLQQQVSSAADLPQKIQAAEAWMATQLPEQPGHNGLLEAAFSYICQRKGVVTVKELTSLLGVNYKWLERNFRYYTGLPPKMFLRQHRFVQACLQLLPPRPADFMAIALDHGYYDQNHLIKEFKQFTGAAPGTFLQKVIQ